VRSERGQITLLVIGFAVILISLVAVVVDASQVMLLRRTLSSVADGAALAGAQSLAEQAFYAGQVVDTLPLDPSTAHVAVVEHLSGVDIDLRLLDVSVTDDRVTVAVSAQADLPLVGAVTSAFDGTTVTARASARSPIS
jgi:uncharacterized membrane protein